MLATRLLACWAVFACASMQPLNGQPTNSSANAQNSSAQPGQSPAVPDHTHNKHFENVNRRGDTAMGFSHSKTTHHFRLLPSGGTIRVDVNDSGDSISRDEIRSHLQQMSRAFADGDLSSPAFTHGKVPPGVPTMKKLRAHIKYEYRPTDSGGEVLIRTTDAQARGAIHHFLRFQIRDHRTGDPLCAQN